MKFLGSSKRQQTCVETKLKECGAMSWFKGATRLGVVAAATGGSVAGFLLGRDERRASVDASWTTGYTPSVKWDWNWDRRDADSLVKPLKHKPDFNNNNNNLTNTSHFSNDINNNMIEAREEKLEKARATASRHLIFVRHGQYNLHAASDQDRTLTRLGRDQAALTGERLKELGLPYSRFVYSTMTRATETANIIREKIGDVEEIDNCDLLREGAPVPPEPPLGSWKPEMHKFYTDGARIEAAFRKYVHRAPPNQEKDSYEVFVCHANVIRYFVCRALQLPPEAWLRISLHNGSLTHLVVRPDGRVALWHLGECGYMPPEKLSRT